LQWKIKIAPFFKYSLLVFVKTKLEMID
jgi:hypothetical protein